MNTHFNKGDVKMNECKKRAGLLLSGTFRGKVCRLSVECYPKTAEIKATLLPTDGSAPILLTQNLGQPMPPYQAFLAEGVLDLSSAEFMNYAERNGLGYLADFKRYDTDLLTGQPRRIAAVFQFDKAALRKIHPSGCARYERHSHRLKCRPAFRRCVAVGA